MGGYQCCSGHNVALLLPADKTIAARSAQRSLPPSFPPSLPWVYEAGSQPARVLLKMPG